RRCSNSSELRRPASMCSRSSCASCSRSASATRRLEESLTSPRSERRIGLGGLSGVVIEADPRLAPEPAGAEHLAQGRRTREAPLAELLEEHVADRAQRVQPDEVRQRERPHRMPRAGLHRLVDLLDRAHALFVGPNRVEHVGDEQPVHDEAGLVLGGDRQLVLRARELQRGRERLLGGGHAADHLHQLHDLGRVEVVQAHELLRAACGGGLVDHGQRRGVGCEDRTRLEDLVDLAPHLELQRQALGDRLDHQVAVGQVAVVDGSLDARAHLARLGLVHLALLRRPRQLLLDLGDALLQSRLVELPQHHLIAGLGRHLGDAVAHQSRAQHSHLLDLLRHWTPRLIFAWEATAARLPHNGPMSPASQPDRSRAYYVGKVQLLAESAGATAIYSWRRSMSKFLRPLGVLVALIACALATAAGAQAFERPFIGSLQKISSIGSTVPTNGDQNPYGIVNVQASTGSLMAGDILISNFNDAGSPPTGNPQGTGTPIVQMSPSGHLSLFAQIDPRSLPGPCPGGVGLTTALAILPQGYVVVGSLPTSNGLAATAQAGCLIVLDSRGHVVETISGPPIDGPWDMSSVAEGANATLFVTNVLNGTVASGETPVDEGTVVRMRIHVDGHHPPKVTATDVIAAGFPERTDPAALVVGPTGVALGDEGTLYVADTQGNRIAAVPGALSRHI